MTKARVAAGTTPDGTTQGGTPLPRPGGSTLLVRDTAGSTHAWRGVHTMPLALVAERR